MQVLLTAGILLVLGIWMFIVLRQLASLRTQVTLAWAKLQGDQLNEAIRNVYNKHVDAYNAKLEEFPANVVSMMAGFKPAKRF